MLVFKKLNTKRHNPFIDLDGEFDTPAKDVESLEETTIIGWKQTPENTKLSDKISLDVKRKMTSESDHFMDGSDYSPVRTRSRNVSEDDDSEIENDEIEDPPPVHLLEEDIEVGSNDAGSSGIDGGYSRDVNTINYLKPVEKTSSDRHLLSQIPPTEKKKWPQKPCVICRRSGVRHDTRYCCKCCNVALCKEPCFQEYHTM